MLRIILSPDSFKGSLSSVAACKAMARGARRVLDTSSAILESVPLADGGEGTLDALLEGAGGKRIRARVLDPLGRDIQAQWGVLNGGRAVIEMAQASGLTLIPENERDALRASSFGTGQLMQCALDAGCSEAFIGIGGSATTDGGTGALAALGAKFLDANERVLAPGGAALNDLHAIDLSGLDARLANIRLTVLCDVSNPLFGENGAAHIYAPQKGASRKDVEILDAGLRRLSEVASQTLGRDVSAQPGAGAAGGLGFALMAFCKAQLKSGIDIVLEAAHFEEKLQGADLVLTGEGAIDMQTLSGKTLAGVSRAARKHGVPVIAFGGRVSLSGAEQKSLGLLSAIPLPDTPMNLRECIARADELLANAVERTLRVWLSRR